MNISELAFKFRKLVFFIVVALLIVGAVSYFTLPSQEDPKITIREALVTTAYPGMSPERVELLITKKLEENIRKIPEIKEITSTSSTGLSIIHVAIQDRYFDLKTIWQNLRNKVSDTQSILPEGTVPSIVNDEFGDVAVITLALTADGFNMSQMYDIAKHTRDKLYKISGTKKIDVLGVQSERIYMEVLSAKLAELGLTPNELTNNLKKQNIILPGGEIDTKQKNIVIEPTGNFNTVEDIGNALISIPNTEEAIPLKDIVTIKRGYIDPPRQASYYNGKKAIIFAISMLNGFNVLEYAPRMTKEIEKVKKTLPLGYNLDIATYQAKQVDKTIKGVSNNVFQTLIIVLVVVMSFLGTRTGLIVGTIVPFVMLTTLALMNFFSIDLERMSLATLIIALGLLVDNGIVIAEDFKRRLEAGASRMDALKGCGNELSVPLLSSSLTTIFFFLPLILAEHVAGEYTRSISLVITITLLTSWILALCLTPTMCYYFIKAGSKQITESEKSSNLVDKFYSFYKDILKLILRFRWIFMLTMFAMFATSIVMAKYVPKQFFPDSDREQVLIYTELPAGVSARTMNNRMQNVFTHLENKELYPYITSFSGYVGYGGPRFVLTLAPEDPADNNGFIVLNIDDIKNQESTILSLNQNLQLNFPDMFFRVKKMFLGSSDSSELEIQVIGSDADVIYNKAQEIVDELHKISGNIDIRTNWQNRITKVIVNVDQQRARRAGISSEDVAVSLQSYFSGVKVTEYREDDDIIPIMFRVADEERFNLDRVRTINVFSSSRGINVPLMQIADFEGKNQYARIEREDMFRAVSVKVRNTKITAEDLKIVLDPIIDRLKSDLPINHTIEYDGVIKDSAEAQKALSANIPLCLGLIIILLVGQFNSYRRPAIIMLTIPLSFIGAVLGLLTTKSYFSFMVTLGLYSLAGIVINNAIVLIDRIDIERNAGNSPYDAIVNACVMRLRPICMTTITTILGLLPLIISKDPLFYGMANAIAFGLGVGTILTLGVVPALYAIMFGVKRNIENNY